MDNDVKSFIQELTEGIAKASELFADGFKVDPENYQKLLEIYPELAQQAQITNDGMIQLDEEKTKAFLQGKQKEIKAEHEETEKALRQKIKLLQMDIDYRNTQIELAKKALDGKISYDEMYSNIQENSVKYENKLQNELGLNKQEWNKQALTDDNKTTAAQISNLSKLDDAIINVSQHKSDLIAGRLVDVGKAISDNLDKYKLDEYEISEAQQTTIDTTKFEELNEDLQNKATKQFLQSQQEIVDSETNLLGKYQQDLADESAAYAKSASVLSNSIAGKDNTGKDFKEHEYYVDELADRYSVLENEIEKVETALNSLDKAQEHMSGSELSKSLKDENKLLERQRKNYQLLRKEQQKELQETAKNLSKYGGFDEKGQLIDFQKTFNNIELEYNNAVDVYNAAVDRYNAMSKEKQETEGKQLLDSAERDLKVAKNQYDKSKEYFDRYSEVQKDIQDSLKEEEDLLYQQIENTLEAWTVKLEMKLDWNDLKADLDDFYIDMSKGFDAMLKRMKEASEDTTNTMLHSANQLKKLTKMVVKLI